MNKELNPFAGNSPAPVQSNAMQESESQRAIQEVQAAMVIAKKFPRDQVAAMDRILNACTRPTLAQTALYSYPRGGQEITGPSIRLAEAMAQEWGNMQFGIRELSSQNNVSTVEAYAWDVETNTRQVKVFQVPHMRYTRAGGNKLLTDPRDIYELVANNGARRLRACILGVIPGDVAEAAVNQCHVTQKANIEVTPETITKMVDTFKNDFGVTEEHIKERLQKRVEAINPSQMLSLRKIYQSMKDGMSKPGDWFDMGEVDTPEGKVSDLNAMVNKDREQLKPQQAATVAATEETSGPATIDGQAETIEQEPHGGDAIATEKSQVAAVPNEDGPWPQYINGAWVDSATALYDEGLHGWSHTLECPSTNKDGTFRAKRRNAKEVANDTKTQDAGPGGDHSKAFQAIEALISMANTEADLDAILKMPHWSDLAEGEPAELQVSIEAIRADIRASQE